MNPPDLYAIAYTLMAEEAGGAHALETQFQEWEEQEELERLAKSPERFAPDMKLPEKAAEQIKQAMSFASPAPLKKKETE